MNPSASPITAQSSSHPATPSHLPAERKSWFPVLGLLIVVLSTSLQLGCINHALVIDDFQLVLNDDGGRGCGRDPIECFSGKLFHLYYRPMLTASFALVQKYHIHNDDPSWFHIENLALHALTVALALVLFRLLLRRRITALVAATLFAFHPVQVAVTTFIGGRTDNLALVFMLTFAIGVTRAGSLLRIANRGGPHRRSRFACAVLWIALSALMFLAAVFTKEQVVPIVLLTPLLIKPRQTLGSRDRTGSYPRSVRAGASPFPFWLTIYLVPITLYSIASSRVLKGDRLPHVIWSPALHIEMVGRTLWYFAKTLFAPTLTTLHLSTLGPWDTPQYFVALLGYVCAVLWIVTLVRVWQNRRYRFMALWTTVTLITCVNLIPIPSTFISPYRAAIPLFGLSGLIGSALVDLQNFFRRLSPQLSGYSWPQIITRAVFAGIIGWFSFTSVSDVPMWQDETALMKAEVQADPNYIPARAALANYYGTMKPPNFARSLAEYDICIEQLFGESIPGAKYPAMLKSPLMLRKMQSGSGPRYTVDYIAPILRCRGWDLQMLGRYANAIDNYRGAMAIERGDSDTKQYFSTCCNLLGEKLMDARDYKGAIEQYKQGLITNADDRNTRNALIAAYRIVGENGKANAVFRMEDRFTGKVP